MGAIRFADPNGVGLLLGHGRSSTAGRHTSENQRHPGEAHLGTTAQPSRGRGRCTRGYPATTQERDPGAGC